MSKIDDLALKAGIQFDEASELFCEETLLSMQMLSIVGGAQNGCTNDDNCTQNGCSNTGCDPDSISWTQNGCKNNSCIQNGCIGSTSGSTQCSTPTPRS